MKEGKHDLYDSFVNASFFSENPWVRNEHLVLPMHGINPRRFWLEVYCRTRSGHFSDCLRTAHIEGFDLRFGDLDTSLIVKDRLNDLAGDWQLPNFTAAKDHFLVNSGIMRSTLYRLRAAFRTAGAIRVSVPTTYLSAPMRAFLSSDGFVEAKGGDVLIATP